MANLVKLPDWPASSGLVHNLGHISGISGGATVFVPSMFFGVTIPDDWDKPSWHSAPSPALKPKLSLVRERDEKIGDTDCFVLASATDDGETRLWIGKEDLLLRKSRQIHDPKPAAVTDGEIDALLAGNQKNLTISKSDLKKKINAATSLAYHTKKPVTIVLSTDTRKPGINSITESPGDPAVVTQIHEGIVVDQKYSTADFGR